MEILEFVSKIVISKGNNGTNKQLMTNESSKLDKPGTL